MVNYDEIGDEIIDNCSIVLKEDLFSYYVDIFRKESKNIIDYYGKLLAELKTDENMAINKMNNI